MEDLHARHTIGPDDVLVFTDANILFERDTLHQLVQHFKRRKSDRSAPTS